MVALLKNQKILLILLPVAVAASVLSAFNSAVLFSVLSVMALLFLMVKKKLAFVLGLLPFAVMSFIPSVYVNSFNLTLSVGQLKPAFLIIIACFVLLVMIRVFRVDLAAVRENAAILSMLFIFFVVCVISLAVNNSLEITSIKYILYTFVFSFGVLFFTLTLGKSVNALAIIKAGLVISSMVALLGILEVFGVNPYLKMYEASNPDYFYYYNEGLHRVVSSIGNPLILGGYLLIGYLFALYLSRTEQKSRWTWMAILHAVVIIATLSRSEIIILILVTFLHLTKDASTKRIAKRILFTACVLASIYFFADLSGLTQAFGDRLLFRNESESFTFRLQSYSAVLDVLRHSNVFFGMSPLAVNQFLQSTDLITSNTFDNVFLNVMAGFGFVGLITLILILFVMGKTFRVDDRPIRHVGSSLIIIFIGMGFSFNIMYFEAVWGVFWFFTGLLLLHRRQKA